MEPYDSFYICLGKTMEPSDSKKDSYGENDGTFRFQKG